MDLGVEGFKVVSQVDHERLEFLDLPLVVVSGEQQLPFCGENPKTAGEVSPAGRAGNNPESLPKSVSVRRRAPRGRLEAKRADHSLEGVQEQPRDSSDFGRCVVREGRRDVGAPSLLPGTFSLRAA